MSGQHTGGESVNVRWRFECWQDGMKVASGEAPNEATATREAMHYAAMYAQDGPAVRVKIKPFSSRAAIALASPGRGEQF